MALLELLRREGNIAHQQMPDGKEVGPNTTSADQDERSERMKGHGTGEWYRRRARQQKEHQEAASGSCHVKYDWNLSDEEEISKLLLAVLNDRAGLRLPLKLRIYITRVVLRN